MKIKSKPGRGTNIIIAFPSETCFEADLLEKSSTMKLIKIDSLKGIF